MSAIPMTAIRAEKIRKTEENVRVFKSSLATRLYKLGNSKFPAFSVSEMVDSLPHQKVEWLMTHLGFSDLSFQHVRRNDNIKKIGVTAEKAMIFLVETYVNKGEAALHAWLSFDSLSIGEAASRTFSEGDLEILLRRSGSNLSLDELKDEGVESDSFSGEPYWFFEKGVKGLL